MRQYFEYENKVARRAAEIEERMAQNQPKFDQ